MFWSRYNTLFHSARFGYFLHNALSNTLLELDKERYSTLEELRDHQNGSSVSDEAFLALLREHKVLIESGDVDRQLLARQYRRNAICFDTSRLVLTICPTLLCNFRCPYCFERSQGDSVVMSPDTVARLINFIKSYKEINHLSITWYGGEPLLGFNVIRDVTEKVKALDLDFEFAGIITNGYLLDKKKIALLNDLRIKFIQITLDGLQDVHDSRRFLADGRATFKRILANIDALMDSSYEGDCAIRVNIDKHNTDGFLELRALLLERCKGKKLSVYAGHINSSLGSLDQREWMDFTFGIYRRSGVMPTGGFYPAGNLDSVCVACTHYSYVVGPEGHLYKCWEDVGKSEMVIGNIHEEQPVTNTELRAQYCTGTDPYSDPNCRECSVLPICGGGCANRRLRAKQFAEDGLEYCSPYKENLITYLEEYIDIFQSREICAAVLSPSHEKQVGRSCRVISPNLAILDGTLTNVNSAP